MTHRDILKQDIEDSLQYAMNFDGLISHLRAKGFLYDWERGSIRAPYWELARFDRLHEEYVVLSGNDIHTENDLAQFISEKEEQIGALEHERQGYRNQLRRPKPPEIETELKEKITATTVQLKPLRRDLAAARRVSDHWRHLYEL